MGKGLKGLIRGMVDLILYPANIDKLEAEGKVLDEKLHNQTVELDILQGKYDNVIMKRCVVVLKELKAEGKI